MILVALIILKKAREYLFKSNELEKMPRNSQKGKKGFAKHCYGTRRHRLYHKKGDDKSKKSPAAPSPHSPQLLVGGLAPSTDVATRLESDPKAQRNLNTIFAQAATRGHDRFAATAGGGGSMRDLLNEKSDDEIDEDYETYEQEASDKEIRSWIFCQYLILESPDSEDWEDYLGEKGTISLIEDAGKGAFKNSDLFRKQIR
jgi:hypothetical protein